MSVDAGRIAGVARPRRRPSPTARRPTRALGRAPRGTASGPPATSGPRLAGERRRRPRIASTCADAAAAAARPVELDGDVPELAGEAVGPVEELATGHDRAADAGRDGQVDEVRRSRGPRRTPARRAPRRSCRDRGRRAGPPTRASAAAIGMSRNSGPRFGGSTTTPPNGSTGPGDEMPMPATASRDRRPAPPRARCRATSRQASTMAAGPCVAWASGAPSARVGCHRAGRPRREFGCRRDRLR